MNVMQIIRYPNGIVPDSLKAKPVRKHKDDTESVKDKIRNANLGNLMRLCLEDRSEDITVVTEPDYRRIKLKPSLGFEDFHKSVFSRWICEHIMDPDKPESKISKNPHDYSMAVMIDNVIYNHVIPVMNTQDEDGFFVLVFGDTFKL